MPDSEVVDRLFGRLDRIYAERNDHDTMIKRNVIERNVERLGHMLGLVRLAGHDDHHHRAALDRTGVARRWDRTGVARRWDRTGVARRWG